MNDFNTQYKYAFIFLPKKWESSFETNRIESDNAKNCDSDFFKIEEDTTKKFGQEILDVKFFYGKMVLFQTKMK